MVNVIVYENGDRVIRPAEPGDFPTDAELQAELDSELDKLADDIFVNRGIIKALGLTIFVLYDKLSAIHPSDFPPMTDAQKRAYIKNKIG